MGRSKILALLLGAATLSACSPYVYNQEISGFNSGVDAIVSSYQTGQQTVDTIVAQNQQATYLAAQTPLHLVGGCFGDPATAKIKLPPCSIVPIKATTALPPTQDQTAIENASPTFNALKNYAAALVAVTNAADDTTLAQATQSLTTAAGGLTSAVGKLEPPVAPASTVVTQASTLIGVGITTYLDWRRYSALRATVPTADQYVAKLGETVEAALNDIRAVELQQASDDLSNAQASFLKITKGKPSQSEYQTLLTALQVKVAAFNQLSAANPAASVTAMLSAHKQLATALTNGTGQNLAVLAAVQKFAAAAAQLKTSIETSPTSRATK